MIIKCHDLPAFLDTIEGLVHRGLTFDANASNLTITLLGGY